MAAKVRVRKVGESTWEVSLVRGVRPRSIVEGDRSSIVRLALRAASLLPRWDRTSKDTRLDSIPTPRGGRYCVVDLAEPAGGFALPDGREGTVICSFQTRELAAVFARDQEDCGGSAVVVDTVADTILFEGDWLVPPFKAKPPPSGASGCGS